MNVADTRAVLTGNAVAVPTTIWKRPGVLDPEANAANAEFLFANGITSAVYAGGVGEHRLSVPEIPGLEEATCPSFAGVVPQLVQGS